VVEQIGLLPQPSTSQPLNIPMKHRQKRVNELLKRELSGIVAREIPFEDVLVTINQVDVAADLKNAHVLVSVLKPEMGTKVIEKLEEHRPELQAALGRNLTMKYTPHLIFHLDESIARGSRVIEIMREIETPPAQPE
jgi:ribosome-binding factor A